MRKRRPLVQSARVLSVFLALVICSCAVKKYIPDDELLLDGYDLTVQPDSAVTIDDIGSLKGELQSVLNPPRNSTLLGMRPGLHFHYRVAKDSAGFIARFLNNKLGEEPVYLSDVEEETTRDILRNRLENRGFFYSRITSSVDRDTSAQEATVNYKVIVPKPYTMETYQVEKDSIPFYEVLDSLAKTLSFP